MNKISTSHAIIKDLKENHYAFIDSSEINMSLSLYNDFHEFVNGFNHLEKDHYLKDNKSFRLRRLRFFYWNPMEQELLPLPHRSYFQSNENNQYAGGIHRHFVSMTEASMQNEFFKELISFCTRHLPIGKAKQQQIWQMEIHQIRILAQEGEPGKPTPEGIHRDGDDFGWVFLMGRKNVKGGISGVYTNDKEPIVKKCMKNIMDGVVFWDEKVMHDASPIAKKVPGQEAYRDILIVSFTAAPTLKRPKPNLSRSDEYSTQEAPSL